MMQTKFGVSNLVEHMLKKYGITLGVVLLGKQYGYTFKYNVKSSALICTDSNTQSGFSGEFYETVVTLSPDELEALGMILS